YAQIDYAYCFFLATDFQGTLEDGIHAVERPFEFYVKDDPQCLVNIERIEVTITTIDDTAQAGLDYEALDLDLTLAPSDFLDRAYPLSVTILPDTVYEGDEHFWIVISDLSLTFRNGTGLQISLEAFPHRVSASIYNYDTGSFIMTDPSPDPGATVLMTSEDGGSDEAEVWLAVEPTVPVTVSISVCDRFAKPCGEAVVVVSSDTLVFTPANYAIHQVLTVTGLDDANRLPRDLDNGSPDYIISLRASYPNSDYDGWVVQLYGDNEDNDGVILSVGDNSGRLYFTSDHPPSATESKLLRHMIGTRLFAIYAWTPTVIYDAPDGGMITADGKPVVLPNDNDLNGYDVYMLFYVQQVHGRTWVALGIGEHAQFWVLLP
ncbi:MAG: hypothetical protein F9K46_10930, partial [Anaerolineae bacterium]